MLPVSEPLLGAIVGGLLALIGALVGGWLRGRMSR